MDGTQALAVTGDVLHLTSFCFDIFLGSSYNQTPPSVKYMTVCFSASPMIVD